MKHSIFPRWLLAICFLLVSLIGGFSSSGTLWAQENEETPGENVGASNLPLPRFVSLKAARANIRVGPGSNYSVAWAYQRQGIPVEIIQEYDNWRKIRDSEGDEGWIYQALLSSKRTAMVTPWQKDNSKRVKLLSDPLSSSNLVAEVEPNVIANIRECNGEWCQLDINGTRGWVPQQDLWGAYPDEKIEK